MAFDFGNLNVGEYKNGSKGFDFDSLYKKSQERKRQEELQWKIAEMERQAEEYRKDAEKKSSFGGMVAETAKGVGNTLKEVGKGIVGTTAALGAELLVNPVRKLQGKEELGRINVFGNEYRTPTGYGRDAGELLKQGEYKKAAGTIGEGALDIISTFYTPAKGLKIAKGGKVVSGVVQGAVPGAIYGAGYGASQSAQEGESMLAGTAKGAGAGLALGGVAGGTFGLIGRESNIGQKDQAIKEIEAYIGEKIPESQKRDIELALGAGATKKDIVISVINETDAELKGNVKTPSDYTRLAKDIERTEKKLVDLETETALNRIKERYNFAKDWQEQYKAEFGKKLTKTDLKEAASAALKSGDGEYSDLYKTGVLAQKSLRRKMEAEQKAGTRVSFESNGMVETPKTPAPEVRTQESGIDTQTVKMQGAEAQTSAGEALPKVAKESAGEALPKAEAGSVKVGDGAGDGEVKTRGLSLGVEEKAVEKKLVDTFGDLPEYKTANMKAQAKSAGDIVSTDYERAKRIAMGQEEPPKGTLPEAVFVAVENKAIKDGDTEMLRRLATQSTRNTEATVMGQRIRTLGERNEGSVVKKMQDVKKAKEERVGKKRIEKGKEVSRKQIEKEMKKTKVTKETWKSFIEEIKCS